MTPTYPRYPLHTVHWKTRTGELVGAFTAFTNITNYTATTPWIQLHKDGRLDLAKGYQWDFGSGPAIDTPEMIKASLVHDAFYELMNLGEIPWDVRRPADRLLRDMLRDSGTGLLRSTWVYLGVRLGYPILRALGRMGPNVERPYA